MYLSRILLILVATIHVALHFPAQQTLTGLAWQSSEPVVQAILFWEEGCPSCEQVLNEFLPDYQAELGERFALELVEVVNVEDINRLYRIGAAYGISKDQMGVPLMIVGDHALVGAIQIPAELPGLVQDYLAGGGVVTVVRETPLETTTTGETAPDDGMWLAWLTMAVMAAGFVFSAWQIWQAFDGKSTFHLPAWTVGLTPLLSMLGIGVAVYLTFIETTQAQAICGPVGDCNAVQNSKYAMLFGVIPIGLLGVLGNLGILAAWAAQRFHLGVLTEYAPVALLGMTIFGTAFSVYLTYLEIFVIRAVCIWCISSAWIMTGLMVLSLPSAGRWLAGAEEESA